jgi:ribosome-binding protein aMBF1 (putative translation factor)
MPQLLTPALLGRLVREARLAAGLSQTALGERVGASRFWIAEFEQGKLTAELGLALRAVQAVGLTLQVRSPSERAGEADKGKAPSSVTGDIPSVDLGAIIAAASGSPSPSPRGRADRRDR